MKTLNTRRIITATIGGVALIISAISLVAAFGAPRAHTSQEIPRITTKLEAGLETTAAGAVRSRRNPDAAGTVDAGKKPRPGPDAATPRITSPIASPSAPGATADSSGDEATHREVVSPRVRESTDSDDDDHETEDRDGRSGTSRSGHAEDGAGE